MQRQVYKNCSGVDGNNSRDVLYFLYNRWQHHAAAVTVWVYAQETILWLCSNFAVCEVKKNVSITQLSMTVVHVWWGLCWCLLVCSLLSVNTMFQCFPSIFLLQLVSLTLYDNLTTVIFFRSTENLPHVVHEAQRKQEREPQSMFRRGCDPSS